jgi:hypothetical protein
MRISDKWNVHNKKPQLHRRFTKGKQGSQSRAKLLSLQLYCNDRQKNRGLDNSKRKTELQQPHQAPQRPQIPPRTPHSNHPTLRFSPEKSTHWSVCDLSEDHNNSLKRKKQSSFTYHNPILVSTTLGIQVAVGYSQPHKPTSFHNHSSIWEIFNHAFSLSSQ